MAAVSLLMLQWALACASCAVVGLLTWALLSGLARGWPALRTRRNVWLAAQIVTAAAAVLPFLPHAGIAPQIMLAPVTLPPAATAPHVGRTLDAAWAADTPDAPAVPLKASDDAGAVMTAGAPRMATLQSASVIDASATDAVDPAAAQAGVVRSVASRIALCLAALWLLVYAAGLAWSGARLSRARRLWRALLVSAQPMSPQALRDHGAFSAAQLREIAQRKLIVLRIDAAISPMLIGVRHPRLLLPAHLDALTREQQHMIIAHELHHLRARDPLCLAIAAILQTVFWFNPALRWMARQMAWALELHCDQHVLDGRPQQQRKQYAAALLQQWTTFTPTGAAAFGGATITARIRCMQQGSLPTLSSTAAWLITAALTAIFALAAVLQPALAYSHPAAAKTTGTSVEHTEGNLAHAAMPAVQSATASSAAMGETWHAPLEKVRVTSFYGVMRSVLPTPHKGVDFGAAKGTPVHATASGIVIAAGPIAENHGRYGNTVIIDHGTQRSLYAHLDSVSVAPGQQVQAGQRIGAVGQSGFATGPHLHLEVRENGQTIDPATRLTNLDAYATPRALKVRRQQQG